MLLIISTSPPSPTSPTRLTSPINSEFRKIINHFYSHCRGDWQIALTKQNFSDKLFIDNQLLIVQCHHLPLLGQGDVYKNIAKGCKTTAFGKLFIFNHLQFSAKLQVFLKLQKIFFRVFSPLLLRHLHRITIGTSVIAIVVHTPHTLPNFAPHMHYLPLWGRRIFIHIVGAIGKSPSQNKTFQLLPLGSSPYPFANKEQNIGIFMTSPISVATSITISEELLL